MIVLNLFIGIIMNGMDEARQDAELAELAKARVEKRISMDDEIRVMHQQLSDIQQQLMVLSRRLPGGPLEGEAGPTHGNGNGMMSDPDDAPTRGESLTLELASLTTPPSS